MDVAGLCMNGPGDDRVHIFDDRSAAGLIQVNPIAGGGRFGSVFQLPQNPVDVDVGRAVVFVEEGLNLFGRSDDLRNFPARDKAQIFQCLCGQRVEQDNRQGAFIPRHRKGTQIASRVGRNPGQEFRTEFEA